MAASPKTQKTAGSARKASGAKDKKDSGSAQKAGSSKQKATAGSARKTSGAKKTAAGSAPKAGTAAKRGTTGSKQKASTGSAQKASTASKQKASTGSKKASTASRQKASTGSRQKAGAGAQRRGGNAKAEKAIYVYGILPADVELASEMSGVGDPAGQVRLVRSDGLAALVSEVDTSKPLGSPDDLTAHQQIVDASAAEVPVLPARFGAVMASEEAVTEELLAPNEDEFHDALAELDGRAQYVIKGRYVEKAILREVLSENRQAARLASKLRDADPDATRDARIKLGEIINSVVAAKRHKDTHALGNAMEGHCVASIVREPTHELDAAHVAFLVDTDDEGDVEQVVEELARDWEGRIEVRLLGPMAAYDFVGTVVPED
jgi:hypothetical protein